MKRRLFCHKPSTGNSHTSILTQILPTIDCHSNSTPSVLLAFKTIYKQLNTGLLYKVAVNGWQFCIILSLAEHTIILLVSSCLITGCASCMLPTCTPTIFAHALFEKLREEGLPLHDTSLGYQVYVRLIPWSGLGTKGYP